MSSLEFLRFDCGPSFFISSINTHSLFELASLEVGFNQSVEGDDVGHARLPRLVHDVFGCLQVLVFHARVEQRVVVEVVQLGAAKT